MQRESGVHALQGLLPAGRVSELHVVAAVGAEAAGGEGAGAGGGGAPPAGRGGAGEAEGLVRAWKVLRHGPDQLSAETPPPSDSVVPLRSTESFKTNNMNRSYLHQAAHGVPDLAHGGPLAGLLVPAAGHQGLDGFWKVSDQRGACPCVTGKAPSGS